MNRRQLRESIFKLLFRIEFHSPEEMPPQEELFNEDLKNPLEDGEPQTGDGSAHVSEENIRYIDGKYEKIMEKLSEIDEAIAGKATGWTIERMGKIELTILRLAVYEILYDEEIPTSVAINEAVELAKKFGRDESAAFVNGVLSKFA